MSAPASTTPDTLFPKIYEFGHFIKGYEKLLKNAPYGKKPPNPVTIIGHVKLHGTHADIVVSSSDNIRIQSRNNFSLDPTDPQKDVHDVAKTLLPLKTEILVLRNQFALRYEYFNGPETASRDIDIIIAGEWVGPKVQARVALEKLPEKIFVIIGANISGNWVPIQNYHDIHNEGVGIYNISRGGYKVEKFHIFNPEAIAATRKRIEQEVVNVETECPFARTLGISGMGEGIVWKAEHPIGADPNFWFKIKGDGFKTSHTEGLKGDKNMKVAGMKEKARVFAEKSLDGSRLEQGWEYLREMGIKGEEKRKKEFLKWLCKDVEDEEKALLLEMKVDFTMLRNSIREIGSAWYAKKSR